MSRTQLNLLTAWLLTRMHADDDRERGDIPGWVMIAIMSAAVVVVLIPLVGPAIAHAFTHAIDNVSNTQSSGG